MATRDQRFQQRSKISAGIGAGTSLAGLALTASGLGTIPGVVLSGIGNVITSIIDSNSDSWMGQRITPNYYGGAAGYRDSFFKSSDKVATYGGIGSVDGISQQDKSMFEKVAAGVQIGADALSLATGTGISSIANMAQNVDNISNIANGVNSLSRAAIAKQTVSNVLNTANTIAGNIGAARQNIEQRQDYNTRTDALTAGKNFALAGLNLFGRSGQFDLSSLLQ